NQRPAPGVRITVAPLRRKQATFAAGKRSRAKGNSYPNYGNRADFGPCEFSGRPRGGRSLTSLHFEGQFSCMAKTSDAPQPLESLPSLVPSPPRSGGEG